MKECTRFLVSPVDAVFLFKETYFEAGFGSRKRAMGLGKRANRVPFTRRLDYFAQTNFLEIPHHLTKSGENKANT